MAATDLEAQRFRRSFLLLMVVAISGAFLVIIRRFLLTLLLAAVFTGLCRPLQQKLVAWTRGRAGLASAATILLVVVLVVVPLLVFMGIVTSQAIEVSESLKPWIAERVADPAARETLLSRIQLPHFLAPYEPEIVAKLGALAQRAGSFLVQELASATKGTVTFLFLLFVMLYAMFFFLRDGDAMLRRMLSYSPLSGDDDQRLLERFVSVARATVKGTVVIGIVQGTLAGLAFAVAGIHGAAFWGTLMAVLSFVPGVGTALVWVPAAIYLFASGERAGAVGLTLWCSLVVGTVDNLIRPRLVGRDTRMSDLLIFLATLGGLVAFGAVGILVGPLIAALFVTVWEIYGLAFRDLLPERGRW
jgi:predicted PurR-regulated permease PerM